MTFWCHNNITLLLVVSVLIINWWLHQVPIWIKPLDYLTVDRIILVFQRSLWLGVLNKFACYESPPLHFFSYYISPMPIRACRDHRGSIFMLHEPEDPEGRGLVSTIQLPSSRNGYYYSSIQIIDKSLKVTWKWSWIQRSFVVQDEKTVVWWPVLRTHIKLGVVVHTCNPRCGETGGKNGKIPETQGAASLACTVAKYTQYHTRWLMSTDTQGCSLTVIYVPWHTYTDAHTHTHTHF